MTATVHKLVPHFPLKPLSSRLFVRVVDEKYEGLLVIPKTAKKPAPMRAEVLAMGPGMLCKDGSRWPMPDCKPGDLILFRPTSGQEHKIGEVKFLNIRDDDVLAVLEQS